MHKLIKGIISLFKDTNRSKWFSLIMVIDLKNSDRAVVRKARCEYEGERMDERFNNVEFTDVYVN